MLLNAERVPQAEAIGRGPSLRGDKERVTALRHLLSSGATEEACNAAIRKNVGVALSGGGFLAYKHAGAVEQLFSMAGKHGHPISKLDMVGTSGGSIVAGVIGVHGMDILKNPNSLHMLANAFQWKPERGELYSSDHLGGLLRDCLGADTRLADCAKEKEGKPSVDLSVTVTDVDHARPILLTADNCDEPLWRILQASSSIPGIFRPQFLRKEGEKYSFANPDEYGTNPDIFMVQDGGLTCNLPLPLLKERHPDLDLIVACDALPTTRILRRLGTLGESGRETLRNVIQINRNAVDHVGEFFGAKGQAHRFGTSAPVAFARGITAAVLGTQMLPQQEIKDMEAEGKLIHMRPSTMGMPVPFMGPALSRESIIRLSESGRREATRVMEATDVHKKIGAIGTHNHLWSQLITHLLKMRGFVAHEAA